MGEGQGFGIGIEAAHRGVPPRPVRRHGYWCRGPSTAAVEHRPHAGGLPLSVLAKGHRCIGTKIKKERRDGDLARVQLSPLDAEAA
jgi:hypothetical protein